MNDSGRDTEHWSVPLREYIRDMMDERFKGSDRYHQALIDERDKRYQERFEATQQALDKAETRSRQIITSALAALTAIIAIVAIVLSRSH